MKPILAGILLLALCACGADGTPERPERDRHGAAVSPGDGLTLSGYARVGIVKEW
ncbi:MAG: argininosuccinate lyase [Paracoccaceae bacterium]